MSCINYFPKDYLEGRKAFIEAAKGINAYIATYELKSLGPQKEKLYTDVCVIGEKDAPNVFLCNSATHGVEGFCGSGTFTGFLKEFSNGTLPDNVKLVLIHALNAHGFAWLRRVTEENVDLNRNFVDHTRPYPKNKEYSKLHPIILPKTWNSETVKSTQEKLEKYVSRHSEYKLQTVLTGGQYKHPDGIFFGGNSPTEASQRFLEIVEDHLSESEHVLFLDWHTGLGAYGIGELLGITRPGSVHGDRVHKWFGQGLTAPSEGRSLSAPLTGTIGSGLRRYFSEKNTDITSLTVEFGTYPVREVLMPLIADNWLHVRGELDSETGRTIKKEIRTALYPDEMDWKKMVWARGKEILNCGIRGLAEI